MKTLFNEHQLSITLQRLAHQLREQHLDFSQTAIIGIQPRGVYLSNRLVDLLRQITRQQNFRYGVLDITFYRDDTRQGGLQVPAETDVRFGIEGLDVVLVDDVLHTGRTIRAAMDALLDFGRPRKVELLTLIDRHFSREVPIQPDYVGQTIDTIISQKVIVRWKENDQKDEVVLVD